MSVAYSSTIEQHTYPNGLVLLAETMPGVQSAAFTLLLPAGAAYESAVGLNLRGGAATMAAEWITRGAGPRDSRELLTALDNLGVSHAESCPDAAHVARGGDAGAELDAALEIVADMVLHPHLEDDEVEPIRALCLQNLRSLEDDPGSKVIYELRRRHFPDPGAGLRRGQPRGCRADAGRPAAVSSAAPPPQRGDPRGGRGDRLAEAARRRRPAIRRLEAAARAEVVERPAGPPRDHIVRETQQIQIALAYPAARSPAPTTTGPAPRRRSSAATPRPGSSPRSARSAGSATRSTPATRASATARPCSATPGRRPTGAQETLDVTLAEIDRLAATGSSPRSWRRCVRA